MSPAASSAGWPTVDFQVVSRRYENKSLILTTNLHFGEWATVFPDAACATALIDRVVHHAEVIAIEGKSFRRREAEDSKAKRTKKERARLRRRSRSNISTVLLAKQIG